MKPVKVEISHKTIVFTVFFLIFLLFLYQIRYTILFLFIAIIFMSALSPMVDRLEKFKIPRGLSTAIFFILMWTIISFGVASLVPPLVEQSTKFISRLPQDVSQITQGKLDISMFQSHFATLPNQIVKIVVSTFNNVIQIFTLMVVVFYLIIERKNLKKYLTFLFGHGDKEKHAEQFINKLELKLGGWVRGQLTLMIIVGLMSYIGLTFLGVEFAVPLAFIAGLFEIIPNIGPTLSMIPAILVAFGTSPVLGLAVFALYFVIQQLENNIIVPKIFSKAVGVSPLIVIISLMIGFRIAGAIGAILSLPTVLFMEIIINDLYKTHHLRQ
ncbi:MAG: AI-2E family transporter [Candidatus Beckwithbacteria bacterium]|nr:AI-2E family transporter [Patescibacteria group bacterium]